MKKTVREDLYEAFDGQKLETALREKRLEQAVALCRLSPLLDRHPYDLSGGEQQRAALCKVCLLYTSILTTISNDDTAEYTVQIVRVFSGSQSTRNLLLKVTDQRLLETEG